MIRLFLPSATLALATFSLIGCSAGASPDPAPSDTTPDPSAKVADEPKKVDFQGNNTPSDAAREMCSNAKQAWDVEAHAIRNSPASCERDSDCTWAQRPNETCFQGSFVVATSVYATDAGKRLLAAAADIARWCPHPEAACGAALAQATCDAATRRCR